MNLFKINGKEYKAKPFDFNLICDLEDMGVSLEEMGKKKMSMIRAYFAICTGRGNEYAGKELNQHFVNGGKFDDVLNAMSKEMEVSDFFQALNKTEETDATEDVEQEKETVENQTEETVE